LKFAQKIGAPINDSIDIGIFDFLLMKFPYLIEKSPENKKIPPLFRETGFKSPIAIHHLKGLWVERSLPLLRSFVKVGFLKWILLK
jgi:hypothetical protein